MRCTSRSDTSALPGVTSAVLVSCPGKASCFLFSQNDCSDLKCLFIRIYV